MTTPDSDLVGRGASREKERTMRHAAKLLALSLTDEMLDSLRADYGNTNVAVLRHWKAAVLREVAEASGRPAPQSIASTIAGMLTDSYPVDSPDEACRPAPPPHPPQAGSIWERLLAQADKLARQSSACEAERGEGPVDVSETPFACADCATNAVSIGLLREAAAAIDAQEDKFTAHTIAVREFLNELYAVMVDPLTEGTITVAEMKQDLLSAAIRDRDQAAALDAFPQPVAELEKRLMEVWHPHDLAWKARFMLQYPDGLDPIIAILRREGSVPLDASPLRNRVRDWFDDRIRTAAEARASYIRGASEREGEQRQIYIECADAEAAKAERLQRLYADLDASLFGSASPRHAPQGWQPIETAPKGSWLSGPNDTRHQDYVEPPRLWLLLDDGEACVGYADAYYAEGGGSYDGGSFWVEKFSGERVTPTHWLPLPDPPSLACVSRERTTTNDQARAGEPAEGPTPQHAPADTKSE